MSHYAPEPLAGGRIEPLGPESRPPFDAFAPLGHDFDRLLAGVVHVALGVSVGLVLASALRRLGLRWTWTLLLVGCLAAWPGPRGGLVSTLLLGGCCACARAWLAHTRDVRAGGDLGRAAATQLGPLDVLDALRSRWLRRAGSEPAVCDGRLLVGHCALGRPVRIPFGGPRGGSHTLVLGATGSGKTVTQAAIVTRAVAAGLGAVVLDPKGDPVLLRALRAAARLHGRRLLEWTPEGPHVYNPLASGSVNSIAERLLAGERFTEPHYLRQAQRYLQFAVRALRLNGRVVSLRVLVEALDSERLLALAAGLPDDQAVRLRDYLDSLTPRQRADLAGVRDRLAILAESDVGPWLEPEGNGSSEDACPAFDLLGALRRRAVVYFALRADEWPLLAPMLAAAIVEDLVRCTLALADEPVPAVVVLDEFSSLAAARVSALFARARVAHLNLVLATQELADLRLPGRESLLEQLLGNLSSLIAHRQVVPDSIDELVRLAGRRGAWRGSLDGGWRWRMARSSEPLLDGELLRGLPVGRAVVVELDGGAVARACARGPARAHERVREARMLAAP